MLEIYPPNIKHKNIYITSKCNLRKMEKPSIIIKNKIFPIISATFLTDNHCYFLMAL